ncbi:hypothetical protein D3C76_1573400 [compost metagenome]
MTQRFADDVATIRDRHGRWLMRLLEVVVTRFQLFPEIRVCRILMALHIGIGHAERINVHLHTGLPEH